LRVSGQWGAKKITGRIGGGSAQLKATTVSGSIALLRRPPLDDVPRPAGPADGPADGPANGPTSGTDGDPTSLRKDI